MISPMYDIINVCLSCRPV